MLDNRRQRAFLIKKKTGGFFKESAIDQDACKRAVHLDPDKIIFAEILNFKTVDTEYKRHL